MEFSDWLKGEMGQRGWNSAELAKRSKLSRSHINRILGGLGAGEDSCRRIADAMAMPPARVFRIAGLIPSYSVPDAWLHKLIEGILTLDANQRDVVTYIVETMILANSITQHSK